MPIWRIGEILLHAEHLASFLQRDLNTPTTIRFRAIYSGLSGRVLRAWANPSSNTFFEERVARSDEAILEAVIPAKDLSIRLAEHIYPLVSSLYERFGVIKLSEDLVQAEVERLLSKKTRQTGSPPPIHH